MTLPRKHLQYTVHDHSNRTSHFCCLRHFHSAPFIVTFHQQSLANIPSYYIRTLLDCSPKPLLLIPKSEVEALFVEIYQTLGVYAGFPEVWYQSGFDIGFTEEGIPRPRYLGRFNNDCSLDDLEAMIPAPGKAVEEPQEVDDRSFPAFRRKMEEAILSGKNKNKAAKEKKRRDRVITKKAWCTQLKRSQCYLGIRPRGTVNKDEYFANPNLTWEQAKAAQAAYEKAAGIKLPKLVPTSPAPYPFHHSVIFICVDVEAYEKNQRQITEIGISTLDTTDLVNTPPGEGGVEWMKKIRARHFRVKEYAHLTNSVHVSGCPDKFLERFGTSEWISSFNAPQVIASCFRHPFSAPGQYTPFPADGRTIGRYGYDQQLLGQYLQPLNDSQQKRNIILVGHDIKSDIQYLQTIGYDVTNLPNLVEAIDTINLFKAMKHGQNTPSLGAVLLELGLTGWHLHNAGNDAGYTMEALIGLSFAALTANPKAIPQQEELDAAAAEARARLIDDIEEWEIADEEGGDGGAAIPLHSLNEMKQKQAFDQGMRRGQKAEERMEKIYSNDWKKGLGSSAYGEAFPSLKDSVERKGEIKLHAANEKTMKEMVDTTNKGDGYVPPHLRGGWGNDEQETRMWKEGDVIEFGKDKEEGGVKLPEKKLPKKKKLAEKTKKRLAELEVDEEYFTI